MNETRMVITQGEHAVSDDPNVVVSTLLGSCVSCCLWDSYAQVGGINHMLHAQLDDARSSSNVSGVNSMELLINDILKKGGARARLTAKVFGGAQMVQGLSEIGLANAQFTLEFLARENIVCVSKSLGGQQARHLLFRPATGIARQRYVRQAGESAAAVLNLPHSSSGNGMELL